MFAGAWQPQTLLEHACFGCMHARQSKRRGPWSNATIGVHQRRVSAETLSTRKVALREYFMPSARAVTCHEEPPPQQAAEAAWAAAEEAAAREGGAAAARVIVVEFLLTRTPGTRQLRRNI